MKVSVAALGTAVLATLLDVCCSLRCYGCYWAINSAPEYGSDTTCKSDQLVAHDEGMVKECYGEDQKCYVKIRSSNGMIRTYYRGCESASMCEQFPTILSCCNSDMCNGDPPQFSLQTGDGNKGSHGNPLVENRLTIFLASSMAALAVMNLSRV